MPSIVAEYGLVEGVNVAAFEKRGSAVTSEEPSWERLDWVGDDFIWQIGRAHV